MKTCQFCILNRILLIPIIKNILTTLNVQSQNFHGRDHAERAVPKYNFRISNRKFHIPVTKITLNVMLKHIRDPLYLSYRHTIFLYAKVPGSCFSNWLVHKGFIRTKFHNCNNLLLHYLLVLYILAKTGECCIS